MEKGRRIRIRRYHGNSIFDSFYHSADGKKQTAVCNCPGEWGVSVWVEGEIDDPKIVETFPYDGAADQRAALAMARGNAHSRITHEIFE